MMKSNEEKLILIISSIVSIILSLIVVIISFFLEDVKWTWCFSILIGQAVSVGCFFKSNAIIDKVLDDGTHVKFLLILNNVLGTLCYTISLVSNALIPGLNILLNGLGCLILKTVTFFVGTFYKKWGEVTCS